MSPPQEEPWFESSESENDHECNYINESDLEELYDGEYEESYPAVQRRGSRPYRNTGGGALGTKSLDSKSWIVNNKIPPPYNGDELFDPWVDKLKNWQRFTELARHRQGMAVLSVLDGMAKNACTDLDKKSLFKADGVDIIVAHLRPQMKRDGWHLFFV